MFNQKKYRLLFIVHIVLVFLYACSSTNKVLFSLPEESQFSDLHIHNIISVDGITLAYRETGPKTSKYGIILVPGSTMYGYYYVPFMKKISKQGIYIRTIDIRGHGNSDGPRGDVPYEDSLIDDLSSHIDDLRLNNPDMTVLIAGHSMGAGICGRYLEKRGYNSVKGVIYIAPFFHYQQPGMKNPGYVDINYFNVFLGDDHSIIQRYHPAVDDDLLVKKYTKIMSKAYMVTDFAAFKKQHSTKTFLLIGKNDELFEWNKTIAIFNQTNLTYIALSNTGHLNFNLNDETINTLTVWLHTLR